MGKMTTISHPSQDTLQFQVIREQTGQIVGQERTYDRATELARDFTAYDQQYAPRDARLCTYTVKIAS